MTLIDWAKQYCIPNVITVHCMHNIYSCHGLMVSILCIYIYILLYLSFRLIMHKLDIVIGLHGCVMISRVIDPHWSTFIYYTNTAKIHLNFAINLRLQYSSSHPFNKITSCYGTMYLLIFSCLKTFVLFFKHWRIISRSNCIS